MDLKKVLEIGEKIEVSYKKEPAEKEKRCYSMIQDLKGRDEVVITLPMREGHPVLLEQGQKIRVDFYRNDGCFTFTARVMKRFKIQEVIMIKLKSLSPVERLQRRNYFRLNVTIPVHITMLTEELQEGDGCCIKGYVLDISGGGMKITSDREMKENSCIECRFSLNNEEIVVKGRVIRVQHDLTNIPPKYEIGVFFVDMPEGTRDLIIKFIFQEQRKLRQKGFV